MNSNDQNVGINTNPQSGTNNQVEASSGKLFLSTIFAGCVALLLLILFWLPAEYGVDLTGVGRTLGLTQMGEMKEKMHHHSNDNAIGLIHGLPGQSDAVDVEWLDEYQYTLAPDEGIEVKLLMSEGQQALYQWSAHGAVVYHDTHGEGAGLNISYEKGNGVPQDQGTLTAAFDGQHGWWWRNDTKELVTVSLRTAGDYEKMLRP